MLREYNWIRYGNKNESYRLPLQPNQNFFELKEHYQNVSQSQSQEIQVLRLELEEAKASLQKGEEKIKVKYHLHIK